MQVFMLLWSIHQGETEACLAARILGPYPFTMQQLDFARNGKPCTWYTVRVLHVRGIAY
jgi:hypothetical protein